MPHFVLFLHENLAGFSDMSPEEMQAVVQRYMAWSDKMRAEGHLIQGQKLHDGEGRLMRKQKGETLVMDGPYVESKEVLGGFFVLDAPSYERAVELSRDCPHLDFGTIEIRQIHQLR